ncbi:hypothetical protein DY468_00020 [Rhodopseudomonas sp. BR0M22]|nr:hypothetical protein [Rhodopseudomonas sp. BR0M22]
MQSNDQIKYVSPARAIWDEHKNQFHLKAHDELLPDLDRRDDGFFYFGLRVFLEHGPNVWPKEAFWFLLRCRFDGSRFFVREQRSKAEFDLGFHPLELQALSEHLFVLLKEELNTSRMVSDFTSPNKIGFV